MAGAGEGPAERLSAFLDRCLPSDEQRAHEWLLWQELALLCIRDPHLAKVGADLYEDLYATVADIVTRGPRRRGLRHRRSTRGRWPRRRWPSPTDWAPGSWRATPTSGSSEARTAIATTVGILVGHDGPLPRAGALRRQGRGVTPRPGLALRRPSRRGFLTGGLALGASLTLPGCAYIRDDAPTDAPLPTSAKAEIDGDLVYFNWADYLAPKVVKGFQEEYGVKVIESNFDSMEGMYAKLAAGNQYDIVFPIAKWVVKLRREGKLRVHRPRPAAERRPGLLLRLLLQRPLVRRRVGRCRSRSPSTRPGSAGAPTRCRR